MPTFWKQKKQNITITTADKWFSRYIRLRDSYDNGFVSCITCGKPRHWKGLHCGHFVTRGHPATRFNEQNSHAQCAYCNYDGKGEQAKHAIAIDSLYGEGVSQMLINLGDIRGQKIHDKVSLKQISDEYRIKAKKLAKIKGLEI